MKITGAKIVTRKSLRLCRLYRLLKHVFSTSSPWATLEELLDKLFFLTVSGDGKDFIRLPFLSLLFE